MTGHREIITSRLHLRKLIFSDAPTIFSMMSDEESIQYANLEKHKSIEDAENFIVKNTLMQEEGNALCWAIVLKESHEMIGYIGLHYIDHFHAFASFAIIMQKEFWNRGYTTEAHKAIINFAFTSGNLNRLDSQFYEKHTAMEKVLIKSGFTREATIRQNFNINGKFENSVQYSIIKDDFLKNPDFFTDNQ